MATDTKGQNETIERMFAAGVHFAYSKSRRHPSVAPFIFGTKEHTEIFDLEKTLKLLSSAKGYVETLGKEGKILLFVAGKSEAQEVVKKTAIELSLPYVASRWIGGTLTNFSEIQKRIKKLNELIDAREAGELAKKYTKRELLDVDREITQLEQNFGGIKNLEKLPDALIVVDPKQEDIAVTEANTQKIPVVALANSDCNISKVQYPIVGNDTNMASITFFVQELADAYQTGKESRLAVADTSTEAEEVEDSKHDE